MAKTKNTSGTTETPLMKQYFAIKAKYPGALLLFRVGDFYETFGEDAIRASKILDIVLTKRANGAASEVELAGFPHHALDSYLPKLIRAGERVAVCDQLEDPKLAKGIVKRGVTEMVTPGLSMNDQVLDKRQNNFLGSIYLGAEKTGIAFLDISTGEFLTATGHQPYMDNLLQGFSPSELVFSKSQQKDIYDSYGDKISSYLLDDWVFQYDYSYEKLKSQFNTQTLKGFGIEDLPEGIIAAGGILHYLDQTEHKEISHIRSISRIEEEEFVWLDRFTIRNLELVSSWQEDGTPLIDILDQTVTPMGARNLRKWIIMPLKDRGKIMERLDMVEAFYQDTDLFEKLLHYLKQVGDLERLISKVATGRINPREMLLLRRSLSNTIPIKEILLKASHPNLVNLGNQLSDCRFLLETIQNTLKEEVPLITNQGGLIRDGLNAELDELRKIAYSGKDYLLKIQQEETKRTGISSLKIAYNKVFGYYLEVTNAHKNKVPPEWIRKQTLVNAERYITEELKTYEEKILNAEDRMVVIEQHVYQELVRTAGQYINQVQENARVLSMLDCLGSFAHIARKYNYTRPAVNEGTNLIIRDGRHPVIERRLPLGESYIPNDIYLNNDHQRILIITGPNMAGKSALLRQTALIVIMAQIGCFVPAGHAEIGIVDKIFTRVGASDNLSRGESTFMVEMTETASILNNLSNRSLVLMDEIGRGTSTYDGVSIAWSIAEFLHDHPKYRVKTLFATHYHELNQLAKEKEGVKNFNVSVKEIGDKIIFMRKLKEGGIEHSFGIHVAQMAGMPNSIILRANEILNHLEKEKLSDEQKEKMQTLPARNVQLNLFDTDPRFEKIKDLLNQLDINTISPVEALLKLNEIKGILKNRTG